LVLVIAGLLITAETGLLVGVLLPGESAVLVLGLLSQQGVVPPSAAALTAVVCAVAGVQLGYWRGRGTGLPTAGRLQRHSQFVVELFERIGPTAVCLCQWTMGMRTLAPRLAGRSGMSCLRFACYSTPTAAIWGAGLVLLGNLAGAQAGPALRWLGYGPGGALVVLVALRWWRRRRRPIRSPFAHPRAGQRPLSGQ
jgi:membrane protein DedA with SNARE-associated domain